MTTTIKIVLIIAVSVGIVAFISHFYGPQNKPNRGFSDVQNAQKYDQIPNFLQKSFPNTDFSKVDPAIQKVLSGGPPKDGIPALDEPAFTPLTEFKRADDIQAIVIEDRDFTKVYPYNILTWHEIVNDTIDGAPVAITFCPLCGSAIVYDRRSIENSTLGVSGALIESNMVMYDRVTETLWQQSTGKALAGELFGRQLELYPFQLASMGEVRSKYPDAQILSEDTGHLRQYGRNPYSGYDEDNEMFIYHPSFVDERFPAKEIMAVWRVDGVTAATSWNQLIEGKAKNAKVNNVDLTLKKVDDELMITDKTGENYPFFFEMWFSFAVQNPDGVVVE